MTDSIEVHAWEADSYQPLVFADGWQVAILNWEDQFARASVHEMERHLHTDEVFVLLRGRAALFTRRDGGDLTVTELEPGKVYNVPAGVWHNLLATRDVSFVIVEDRDTHLHDTELRPITNGELAQLDAQLPAWAAEETQS